MVLITISDENDIIASMDVHEEMNIATIVCIIENDYKLNMNTHELIYNGKPVNLCDTLKSLQIKEGDLLFIRKKLLLPPQDIANLMKHLGDGMNNLTVSEDAKNKTTSEKRGMSLLNMEISAEHVNNEVEKILSCRENRPFMLGIKLRDKGLYEAIVQGNVESIRNYVKQDMEQRKAEFERQQRLYIEAATNPLTEEAQKFIAESIRNNQIRANYEMSRAYLPESVRNVCMLYIPIELHKTKLKAFIDSGAQSSLISKRCAEKCNILHFMDTNFSSIAIGLGIQKTLGRVHWIDIKVGTKKDFTSLTVIENSTIDFILGLDLLKYFKCCINLKENVLMVGEEKIPFLDEKEIPKEPLVPDDALL